jgi:hypothetical protein
VPAIPRGGSPIFSTSTNPSNGGDPPAATGHTTHKDKGHIVVKTKPKALVVSRNHPKGPKRK